jgi:hypothetical protein
MTDERTAPVITKINSTLRNRLKAETIVRTVQLRHHFLHEEEQSTKAQSTSVKHIPVAKFYKLDRFLAPATVKPESATTVEDLQDLRDNPAAPDVLSAWRLHKLPI